MLVCLRSAKAVVYQVPYLSFFLNLEEYYFHNIYWNRQQISNNPIL